MDTKCKLPPLKCVLFFAFGGGGGPVADQLFFPMVFSLSGQSGKLKGTSEKAWGVTLIFLALYFVRQKCVPP